MIDIKVGATTCKNNCEAVAYQIEHRRLNKENAALREQVAAKDEALRQAAMLADIASDWNLEEIEIDGEIVLTYDLHKRFMQALEGSSATGEGE